MNVDFLAQALAEIPLERINISEEDKYAPLYYDTPSSSTPRLNRHWLTGLLDFDDFALLQPARARLFRQFCDLHAKQQLLRRISPADDLYLTQRLDNASIEVLGYRLEDLCLDMEFVPQEESVRPPPSEGPLPHILERSFFSIAVHRWTGAATANLPMGNGRAIASGRTGFGFL